MSGLELNLPEMTRARTANVRVVDPLGIFDSLLSWFQSNVGPSVETAVQAALQQLIKYGVPIAAKAMINSMSYSLGNSQLPVDTSFSKSSGWAVALIIVLSCICAAVVALVAVCIWWESKVEQRRQREAMKDSSNEEGDEDDGGIWEAQARGNTYASRSSEYEDDRDSAVSPSTFTSGSHSDSESSGSSSSDDDDELAWQSVEASTTEDERNEQHPRHSHHDPRGS